MSRVEAFVYSVETDLSRSEARLWAQDLLATDLSYAGFSAIPYVGRSQIVFESYRRPVWAIVLAIFCFPLGLLALSAKERDTTITVETKKGGDVIVSGVARRRVAEGVRARMLADLCLAPEDLVVAPAV